MTTNPEDTEGTDALLSDPEAVMQIWLKYKTKDFIQLIVHETKEEIFIIEAFINVFLNDPDIASQSIKSTLGAKTVEEYCAMIMRRLAKLRQIMSIAWEYSQTLQSTNTEPDV